MQGRPKGKRSAAGSSGGSWFACLQFFLIVGTFVVLAMVFIFLNFHAHGQVIIVAISCNTHVD